MFLSIEGQFHDIDFTHFSSRFVLYIKHDVPVDDCSLTLPELCQTREVGEDQITERVLPTTRTHLDIPDVTREERKKTTRRHPLFPLYS